MVLDEAQTIENPAAAAGRAARAALTGIPVENRLADLWSLFAFLNPGYLGGLRSFHRLYAVPIERENDPAVRQKLRARLAPFMRLRITSDPAVAP